MNIETRIDKRLWAAVQQSYESRNYSAAILDAVYFLTSVIREKSGLEGDGVALVGQAFGGADPPLKVNRLQTESEINVQKGIEQLLRGLYQAVRNPRSHDKHTDVVEDADALIVFVDYLLRTIDLSKSAFTKTDFLKKVFDEDFVGSDRYAQLLVDQIPPKYLTEIFIEAFRQKESGNGANLAFFFHALWRKLGRDDHVHLCHLITQELETTESAQTIGVTIQIMPKECWLQYGEAARLRIENKLVKAVEAGFYKDGKCVRGTLGTWANRIHHYFSLKNELEDTISMKLASDDWGESEYVFQHLFSSLPSLRAKPSNLLEYAIKEGLKSGDRRFKAALDPIFRDPIRSSGWCSVFQAEYDGFVAKKGKFDDLADDIPF